jgi:uracil DNA glycosylase
MSVSSVSVPVNPYKAFNGAFKNLLKDLKRARPEAQEVKMMYVGYKLAKTFNMKCICNTWYEAFQEPYYEYLRRHDSSFATAPDFVLPPSISPIYAALTPAIVAQWTHLTAADKDMVWMHIDVLIVLCTRALNA